MAQNGLVTIPSQRRAKETLDRLEALVKAAGMSVFTRIDHAAGAAQAGLDLRPTTVLIFGNAEGGTPLMQAKQAIGIDLPLKVLVWEDEGGKTWLTYNDPHFLAARHGLGGKVDPIIAAMTAMLAKLTQEAGAAG